MGLALREIHSASPITEHQLVAAVRAGDDRAFETLFSRYRRRISSYVYGLVGDYGRSEDITQEVFISALRRLRETERPIAFRAWIYEIARNACIDEHRRTRRAMVVSLDEQEREPGGQIPPMPDTGSPELRWERKQQLGHLFGAFSGLSEAHHQILVMRELEGLSYGEIGSRLGMSRPVVESTLFRARRRLTQEYGELSSGQRCQDVRAAVDTEPVRALASRGIRERRRIAGHLEFCDDCLRYARAAGIDEAALRVPPVGRRVAALLPFGWLRFLRGRGRRSGSPGPGGGGAGAGWRARLARPMPALQRAANGANGGYGLGRGAAAAAVIVAGGVPAAIILPAQGAHPRHGPAVALSAVHDAALAPPGSAVAATVRLPASGAPGRVQAAAGHPRASAFVGYGHGTVGSPFVPPARGASTSTGGPAGGAPSSGGRAATPVGANGQGTGQSAGGGPATSARLTGSATSGLMASTTTPLAQTGQTLSRTVGATGSAVQHTVGGVGSAVQHTVGGVGSAVQHTVGGVGSAVQHTVGGVGSAVQHTVGGVGSAVQHTVGGVGSAVQHTVGGLGSAVQHTVGGLGSAVQHTVGGLGSAVQHTVGGLGSAVQHTVGGLGSAVQHTVGGLGSAVQHTVGGLGSAVQHTVGAAGSAVQHTVGASAARCSTRSVPRAARCSTRSVPRRLPRSALSAGPAPPDREPLAALPRRCSRSSTPPHRRLAGRASRRPLRAASAAYTSYPRCSRDRHVAVAVGYSGHRGVAQPGSAHRSGR